MSEVLDQLEAAREWLSDREHWTIRNLGLDVCGRPVEPSMAVQTCASGALIRVGCEPDEPAYRALSAALGGQRVCTVNDREGYAAIMDGFDRAITTERERIARES